MAAALSAIAASPTQNLLGRYSLYRTLATIGGMSSWPQVAALSTQISVVTAWSSDTNMAKGVTQTPDCGHQHSFSVTVKE